MPVSLLVLIGFTKIVLVSYAYSINNYHITLLMVNGKRPVKYVCTLLLSGSTRPIAANTEFLFFSPTEKICFHFQC